MSKSQRILLGVTGGIAAYKAITLTSLLKKAGHDVQVVLTEHGAEFVTPLAFETLSERPVITSMFGQNLEDPTAHISYARWADLVLLAPATANIIAKAAHGLADDFLSTLLLAYDGPLHIAPAMNDRMYLHPATQENMALLRKRGASFLAPQTGLLACKTVGIGKMMEPEDIFHCLFAAETTAALADRHILVSAGPTREALDPVRFISNHSSGKMGYAIAEAAQKAGATVTLVSGPVALPVPTGLDFVPVVSTKEMFSAIVDRFENVDAVIMAAAPSDYRPITYSDQKIKKATETLSVSFERNPDILSWLGEHKTHQCLVGFAAESQEVERYALDKLKRKRLDFIVANDITAPDAGFGHDVNTVLIASADGSTEALPTMEKTKLAEHIVNRLVHSLNNKNKA